MQGILDDSVIVGKNVTIEPYCIIQGDTVLKDGCNIGSFSVIINSTIGEGAVIKNSRITDSNVGEKTTVGPYAHIREYSTVGDRCRIGNFVELKNSTLGNGTKASHLAYIGDATIGENCNIGCGAIFVNYDGKTKHHTTVGDRVFIGSNCNIIAPLTISNDCFVACGTTLTKSLKYNDFVIGRAREEIKHDKAEKYLKQ